MRIGYEVSIRAAVNGGFIWKVTKFGSTVVEGTAKNQKEAEKVAGAEVGKLVVKGSKAHAHKQKWYLKLRQYTVKRPYGVAAAVEQLLAGNRLETARLQAEENELAWWERDKDPAHAWPLHELSKTPEELLALVYECTGAIGWVTFDEDGGVMVNGQKLRKWANRVFGARWFDTGPGGGED